MPRLNFNVDDTLYIRFSRIPWGIRGRVLTRLVNLAIQAYDNGDLYDILEDRVQILNNTELEILRGKLERSEEILIGYDIRRVAGKN